MSSYSSNIPAHLKTNLQALTAPQINSVHLQKIRSAILCFLTVCATKVTETVYCFRKQFSIHPVAQVFHRTQNEPRRYCSHHVILSHAPDKNIPIKISRCSATSFKLRHLLISLLPKLSKDLICSINVGSIIIFLMTHFIIQLFDPFFLTSIEIAL